MDINIESGTKINLGKYIQETSLLRFLTSEELGYNDLKET